MACAPDRIHASEQVSAVCTLQQAATRRCHKRSAMCVRSHSNTPVSSACPSLSRHTSAACSSSTSLTYTWFLRRSFFQPGCLHCGQTDVVIPGPSKVPMTHVLWWEDEFYICSASSGAVPNCRHALPCGTYLQKVWPHVRNVCGESNSSWLRVEQGMTASAAAGRARTSSAEYAQHSMRTTVGMSGAVCTPQQRQAGRHDSLCHWASHCRRLVFCQASCDALSLKHHMVWKFQLNLMNLS